MTTEPTPITNEALQKHNNRIVNVICFGCQFWGKTEVHLCCIGRENWQCSACMDSLKAVGVEKTLHSNAPKFLSLNQSLKKKKHGQHSCSNQPWLAWKDYNCAHLFLKGFCIKILSLPDSIDVNMVETGGCGRHRVKHTEDRVRQNRRLLRENRNTKILICS